ncbi:MAG: hypothetical protein ACTS5G_01175, partial [Burkholderiales bacterium]
MRIRKAARTVFKRALLATLIVAGFKGAFALAQSEPQGPVTELGTVTVTAAPLNKAFEVNAGAF